jgi:hypothetical protein
MWIFYENSYSRKGIHAHILIKGIFPEKHEALRKKCDKFFLGCVYFNMDPLADRRSSINRLLDRYGKDELIDFDFFKINANYRGVSHG